VVIAGVALDGDPAAHRVAEQGEAGADGSDQPPPI
jgi:hypothetical protein